MKVYYLPAPPAQYLDWYRGIIRNRYQEGIVYAFYYFRMPNIYDKVRPI